MNIGYIRVKREDDSEVFNEQHSALVAAGVDPERIFSDRTQSNVKERAGLKSCVMAMREHDTLVVWRLDMLGRDLRHLVKTVHKLKKQGVDLRVLTGLGREIDTATPDGELVYHVFEALSAFEHRVKSERTKAGLAAAARRGRKGGRKYALSPTKIRAAQDALQRQTPDIEAICNELGVTRPTLYRYMDSSGKLREAGKKALKSSNCEMV